MKRKDMEILEHKTNTHQQTISKEIAETREMQAAIASLTEQRDMNQASRDGLKKQIADTQKEIDSRLAAQRAHAACGLDWRWKKLPVFGPGPKVRFRVVSFVCSLVCPRRSSRFSGARPPVPRRARTALVPDPSTEKEKHVCVVDAAIKNKLCLSAHALSSE